MKKIVSLILTLAVSVLNLSALPGFKPFIQDVPGDFVYYRDYTFTSESYVGFLYYGNSAYAARYYSPADKKAGKSERNIMILFSVDEEKNHMDLTGEKVLSLPSQEDYEIVNYLHDLVYEFNSRRIKAGIVDAETVKTDNRDFLHSGKIVSGNYVQFGGDVKIVFDYMVPLFNLKSIVNYLDEPQLEIVTTGRVATSSDNGFDGFKGVVKVSGEKTQFKAPKNHKTVEQKYENVSVNLDLGWEQKMENIWVNGDNAVLYLVKAPVSNVSREFILRQSLICADKTYFDWSGLKIEQNNDEIVITGTVFENNGKRAKKQLTKILIDSASKNNQAYMLMCSVYESAYKPNYKYFNSILDSFKILK